MSRGVPGSTCTLRVDHWTGPLPDPGDFIRTEAGSCYRVERVRRARPGSKTWGRFECTRLEHDSVPPDGEGVFGWAWSPR